MRWYIRVGKEPQRGAGRTAADGGGGHEDGTSERGRRQAGGRAKGARRRGERGRGEGEGGTKGRAEAERRRGRRGRARTGEAGGRAQRRQCALGRRLAWGTEIGRVALPGQGDAVIFSRRRGLPNPDIYQFLEVEGMA